MIRSLILGGTLLLVWSSPAQALFHLWTFTEFFSTADGSAQFIEMRASANNEHFAAGGEIRSSATGNVFSFPGNLSSAATFNRHLLIATDGFGALPGGVTPDFTIPPNFFNPAGDTIRLFHPSFGEFHSRTFTSLPTDGVMSLNYPPAGGTVAVNSPTNFAGASGSVDLSAPPALPGDFNDDGTVDAADYTVWRDGLGTDFEPDQYFEWKENFGATQPAAAAIAAAVPEPATILVAALAMLLTCLWQRPPRRFRLAG